MRQRLSIARALFEMPPPDPDDPPSALDAGDSEARIFEALRSYTKDALFVTRTVFRRYEYGGLSLMEGCEIGERLARQRVNRGG